MMKTTIELSVLMHNSKLMKRHYIITLLFLPLLLISCSGHRKAVDEILFLSDELETETLEKDAILGKRLALLDSVISIQANNALNLFLKAQRQVSRGKMEDALDSTALSLEIYETADVMILKSVIFSFMGRHEEASFWFYKASMLNPSVCINKYDDMLRHLD